MRIAAIGVHADVRGIASDQTFAPEGFHDPLLDFVLVGAAVTGTTSDFLEGPGGDAIDFRLRRVMRGYLRFRQRRFKARNEVRGRIDLLAEAADKVEHSGVHEG